jgi:hypothetical protein
MIGRRKLRAEQFVRIWQEAHSIEDVCRLANLNRNAAETRARIYRWRGVELQFFGGRQNRSSVDWKRLREVAEQFRRKL